MDVTTFFLNLPVQAFIPFLFEDENIKHQIGKSLPLGKEHLKTGAHASAPSGAH